MRSFEKVWEQKKREGYQYGRDALENVHFGWQLHEAEAAAEIARLRKALECVRDRVNEPTDLEGIRRSVLSAVEAGLAAHTCTDDPDSVRPCKACDDAVHEHLQRTGGLKPLVRAEPAIPPPDVAAVIRDRVAWCGLQSVANAIATLRAEVATWRGLHDARVHDLEEANRLVEKLRGRNRGLHEEEERRTAERDAALAMVKRLREMLRDCGTHHVNADTCGVCKLHFAECEADRIAGEDEEYPPFDPAKSRLACPGARARAMLAEGEEK